MSSQFVDLNGDGHLDYVSATFDGSPHVAYGDKGGFTEPVRLKDVNGERILISHFWNYESKAHEKAGRSMPDGQPSDQRCISALAHDWDGDGDFDLLLGSYEEGRLYRQMNEGTNAAPRFTGKNIAIMAGNKPFALPAKMTTPRLVDWDGDGDLDLIAGSFGDSYGDGKGGGVYLSINDGGKGEPAYGPLQILIKTSNKTNTGPDRPDAGLYADAIDYDGDGDLDLVVGGYAMWTPKKRTLTAEEKASLKVLREREKQAKKRSRAVSEKYQAAFKKAGEGLERGSPERRQAERAVGKAFRERLRKSSKETSEIRNAIGELVPSKQRRSFVWLYERK